MDQLLPWLALIPAVPVGAIGALLGHQRGADWDWSVAGGALLGGAVYGLVLLVGTIVYVRAFYG